jgi:hypothetical protein
MSILLAIGTSRKGGNAEAPAPERQRRAASRQFVGEKIGSGTLRAPNGHRSIGRRALRERRHPDTTELFAPRT